MVNIISILSLLLTVVRTDAASTQQKKKTYDAKISRRDRNLDHWDAETLAAYLGLDLNNLPKIGNGKDPTVNSYVGIDAAVMFYAQWCQNCHRFAPIWDAIATMVQAGSTQSGLVMSLFNCEQDDNHAKLCDLIGVTHYPTLMFIGAGPFPDALGSLMEKNEKHKTSLVRTMKYRGNFNVGDSVLDWIQVMRGLSTWYKWNYLEGGWLRFCRTGLWNILTALSGKKPVPSSVNSQLPIGIPPISGVVSDGVSSYSLQKELYAVEKKLDSTEQDLKDYKLAASHAGFLIDSFLFPMRSSIGNETTKPIDIFALMTEKNIWNVDVEGSEKAVDRVLKACFVDLTLDYCTRLSTKLTTEYVQSIANLPDEQYPTLNAMELELKSKLKEAEPYCALLTSCYKSDFKEETCRPKTCPLIGSDGACAYVASCLSEHVQEEYADALGLSMKGESMRKGGAVGNETANVTEGVKKDESKKTTTAGAGGAWGVK